MRISGGGRCNVTHHCFDDAELVKHYPRGFRELRQVFSRFSVKDTIAWFEKNCVKLKSESDGRMFPVSDSSETIIDCFHALARKCGINIVLNCDVFSIKTTAGFILNTSKGVFEADAVICAFGGHHKSGSYGLIRNLGHSIVPPVPSLFTLNLPEEDIRKLLQGVAVKNASVSIKDLKVTYNGPVLITHWGLSGPAVLKLSAFAAREFHGLNYTSAVTVNWAFPKKKNQVEEELFAVQKQKNKSLPSSAPLFGIPRSLWEFLCQKAGMTGDKTWAETGRKQTLQLAELVCSSVYKAMGKTTFKEEFVTCGGITLKEIDFKTMQSKIVPGLYFCGEVLDIDGITGGFNFQAAWSTAWICAISV